MDDKELYEILNNYAESTRSDKSVAFSKLNRQSKPARKVSKQSRPRIAFASAMCVVCLILCIVLPLNMPQNPEKVVEPSYCSDGDYVVGAVGQDTQVLDDQYHIFAHYPNPTFPTTIPDTYFEVLTVRNASDQDLIVGAIVGYGGFDMEDDGSEFFVDVNVTIMAIPYCYPAHKNYHKLPNVQQWKDYQIRYASKYNEELTQYEISVYFTDSRYSYFVDAYCSEDMNVVDFLNQYYA